MLLLEGETINQELQLRTAVVPIINFFYLQNPFANYDLW